MAEAAANQPTVYVTIVGETCCNCGIAFGMPDSFMRQKRRDTTNFFCPNGHPQHYAVSEVDKLRKQLELQKAATEYERARAQRIDRQLVASRGQITRTKNRVANGVCPCCNRTFQDLGRHMTTKHCDYRTQELP